MTIFDLFESEESLLEAIKGDIKTNEEGKFVLASAVDKSKRYFDEIEHSKGLRERAQKAETQLKEYAEKEKAFESEKASLLKQIAEHEKIAGNSEELRQRLHDTLEKESNYLVQIEELQKQIDPLTAENTAFKEEKVRNTIQSNLIDAAKKFGVRPEAYEDVKARLANDFYIDEVEQLVYTKDSSRQTPEERLKAVLKECPHWLPPSVGGGSTSGQGGANSREALYAKAKESNDRVGMIDNAPIIEQAY